MAAKLVEIERSHDRSDWHLQIYPGNRCWIEDESRFSLGNMTKRGGKGGVVMSLGFIGLGLGVRG